MQQLRDTSKELNLQDEDLQDDDLGSEEFCEECGEQLSPNGVCPICSPEKDEEDSLLDIDDADCNADEVE